MYLVIHAARVKAGENVLLIICARITGEKHVPVAHAIWITDEKKVRSTL